MLLFIHVESIKAPESYLIVPLNSDRVRMPKVYSRWSFRPDVKQKTRVTLLVFADPGGWIPKWIVNWASRDVPWELIAGLRKQVKNAHTWNGPFLEKYKQYLDWH